MTAGNTANVNRKVLFDLVRKSLFGGRFSQGQVDGLGRILDYWLLHWPKMPIDELAYVLATVKWETAHTMQPIEEGYPLTGEKLRAYQRRLRYYPAYGRGLVQTTWPKNYARLGLNSPADYPKALEWPYALKFLFEGMIFGWFTGHKLADYISAERRDYVGARAIVNPGDRAATIAGYAEKFLAALRAAKTVPDTKRALPPAFNSAVNGAWSTIAGVAAWLFSYVKSNELETEALAALVALGFVLVFFVGGKAKRPPQKAAADEAEPQPQTSQQPEKTEMSAIDPALLLQFAQSLERFSPLLEKALQGVLVDLPKVVSLLEQLKPHLNKLMDSRQPAPADPTVHKSIQDFQAMLDRVHTQLSEGAK